MNNFSVIGRLGQDADLRYSKSGTPVISFRVAFEEGFGDNKTTTWMSCGIMGKRATDKLCSYLTKGKQVGLVGSIKLREWQSKDGPRTDLQMMVNDLTMIGGNQDGGQQQAPQQRQATRETVHQPQDSFEDEDLPF